MPKLAKETVDYEHPAKKSDHCGICRHYVPGGQTGAAAECGIVRGAIRPEDWCNRFSRSRARSIYG